MSMKKAVASARILHKRFLPFMPYPYYYDPLEAADDNAAAREGELLGRENAIYEKWFTDYVCIKLAFLEEEDTDVLRLDLLSEAVKGWYGLTMVTTELDDITNNFKKLSHDSV